MQATVYREMTKMREMGEGKCQGRCMEGEGGCFSMDFMVFYNKWIKNTTRPKSQQTLGEGDFLSFQV